MSHADVLLIVDAIKWGAMVVALAIMALVMSVVWRRPQRGHE